MPRSDSPRWVSPVLIGSFVMLFASVGIVLWMLVDQFFTAREHAARHDLLSELDAASFARLREAVIPLAGRLLGQQETFLAFGAGVDHAGKVTLLSAAGSGSDVAAARAVSLELDKAVTLGRFVAVCECRHLSDGRLRIRLETASEALTGYGKVQRSPGGEVSIGEISMKPVQWHYFTSDK